MDGAASKPKELQPDCPSCRAFRKRVAELQRVNEELWWAVEEVHRAGKRQAGPFSKGPPLDQTFCGICLGKETMMSTLKEFTRSKARPLPVILLADVSGSMSVDGKIEALNQAVHEMISTFAAEDDPRVEIQVCIVTFGGEARLHTPLQPARNVRWADMEATGGTPMGAAMEIAASLIEDPSHIPHRSYRPTVLLVSDGQPTDAWQGGLDRLVRQGRGQKADRIAMAIGGDADEAMLQHFLGDPAKKVFRAEDARKVRHFFRVVTMTVTTRSRGADPDDVPSLGDPFAIDNL